MTIFWKKKSKFIYYSIIQLLLICLYYYYQFFSSQNILQSILQICTKYSTEKKINFNSTVASKDSSKVLQQLSKAIKQSYRHCFFEGLHIECDSFFTKIITNYGVCYTFNILNASEIYKEDV